jgi:hypothetical protein
MSEGPQWGYMERGTVLHALRRPMPGLTDEWGPGAVCGAHPYPDHWHGTHGQSEQERAAALPHCSNCSRLIERIGKRDRS